MKPAHLDGKVVVITGASSGIGRATALAFARAGATLVLTARRADALARTVEDCVRLGGQARAIPGDVTDEAAMVQVADTAVREFGRLDVWINNAGVGLFGPFAGAELAAHRRVVETNLFGAFHGAAAALPHFLRQRRGTLITNISIGGLMPVPFAAAYTASKFGLRGFMASLRQEVSHVPDVRLCSVFPATVDTPGFEHGANVSGRQLSPGWPILAPEEVAQVMLSLVEHPRDEVPVGLATRAGRAAYALAPLTTERAAGAVFRRYVRRGPPERKRLGNLFAPVEAGTDSGGGWRQPPSSAGRVARQALVGGALVAGVFALHAVLTARGT